MPVPKETEPTGEEKYAAYQARREALKAQKATKEAAGKAKHEAYLQSHAQKVIAQKREEDLAKLDAGVAYNTNREVKNALSKEKLIKDKPTLTKLVQERPGSETQYSSEGEELEWVPERVSEHTGKTIPGQYSGTGVFDPTKKLGYQPGK
tara:strand:- start:184 stop:633 length:450 start_codon:yes stop_codon:yes gene_type:complete